MIYRIFIFLWLYMIFAMFTGNLNPIDWRTLDKILFLILSVIPVLPFELDFEKKEQPSDILKKNLTLFLELWKTVTNPYPNGKTKTDEELGNLVFYHSSKENLENKKPETG